MAASDTSTETPKLRELIASRRSTLVQNPVKMDASWILWHVSRLLFFLLILILIPILLPVSLGFRFYRSGLIFLVKRRLGKRIMPCSGRDSVWLQDTKENPAIINAAMCLKGEGDLDQWRRLIMDRLVEATEPGNPGQKLFPKVTRFPTKVLHRYVWIEEEAFDIADHVVQYASPVPAEDNVKLEAVISELCSRPLDSRRAAWQLTLLLPPAAAQGAAPGEPSYHIVFRMHHSIGDGISLVRLLMQRLVDTPPEARLPARFSTRGRLLRQLRAVYEGPAILLERLLWPADRHILHGPRLSGNKLLAWSQPIPLDLVKRMKTATGTTVNDVLTACLAAAFRTHLIQHDATIPKDFLCYVPVDIRPPAGKLVLDNQFALVFLPLPMDQADILDTLWTTKQRMDKVKASPEPVINSLLIRYCMSRLPNWLTSASFDWLSRKCSMVLSNVPGPQQKLSIAGQTLETLVFWPPQRDTVGLGVSIFSYDGQVRLGIMVDKALMADPHPLMDAFVAKIQEMASRLKLA